MLQYLVYLQVLQYAAGQAPAQVQPSCCSQVFLSSQGVLADTNSRALGIYTVSSQKIATNPHPVYVKHTDNGDYYLYFRDKEDELPQGWVVGPQLLEDTFFITTLNLHSDCPAGIFGGYDGGDVAARDGSFSIDCHSDAVKVDCCRRVRVTSPAQPGVAGAYTRAGDHNGHTWYQGGPSNSSLYYRKAGHGPDGWVVAMGLGEADFILTTRQTAYCPDAVTAGFDHDAAEDAGFRVTCEVSFEEAAQDPGIPAAPLEVLKPGRAISSSARDTLRSSACFRILVAVYVLIMKIAEDIE